LPAVLGIDAAWTEHQPSGIALLAEESGRWRCVAVEPSYNAFNALADGIEIDSHTRIKGSLPDPARLLQTAKKLLGGHSVSLVTVDIPVADVPIESRRAADNAISSKFGSNWCSTHSPSPDRPGHVSTAIRKGFVQQGFDLATTRTRPGMEQCLVEVFPHVALLTLLKVQKRVRYKIGKSAKYWHGATLSHRKKLLLNELHRILSLLKTHIKGISLEMPEPSQAGALASLKRYEDCIDALVCAWVGIKYLCQEAMAYGDETAAIWVPT
jgi:predicted RNase H-like nuclease